TVAEAFSGDDEVGTDASLGESARAQTEPRSGEKTRVQKCDKPRSESTRRSRAGHIADGPADEFFDHVGVPGERVIELADDLGCRTLLGSVDRGGTFGAEKRITHVARYIDRRTDEAWIGLTIDAGESRQRGATLGKVDAVAIQKV